MTNQEHLDIILLHTTIEDLHYMDCNTVPYLPEEEQNNDRQTETKLVHEYNEGDGNPCGKVYFVPEFNFYFEVSGWYSSWDTSTIDTCEVVYPYLEASLNIKYNTTPLSEGILDNTIQKLKNDLGQFKTAYWQPSYPASL